MLGTAEGVAGVIPLTDPPATLSARFRESDLDLTWLLPAPGAVDPTAVVVVTCGAGDDGLEGRLRMGRVRSAFILEMVWRARAGVHQKVCRESRKGREETEVEI